MCDQARAPQRAVRVPRVASARSCGDEGSADNAQRRRESLGETAVSTSPNADRAPDQNDDRKKSASRRGF